MPAIPKTRPDDRRGAPKGSEGNPPHQRNDQAAAQIEVLAGFGMPVDEIIQVIESAFGQGFAKHTIQRHYGEEFKRGKAKSKSALLNRAHQMAMGQNVPQGVTPDRAYEISARKVAWLLAAIHGIKDKDPDAGQADYAKILSALAGGLPD